MLEEIRGLVSVEGEKRGKKNGNYLDPAVRELGYSTLCHPS